MGVSLPIRADAPLFDPESKNVWADVESIRPGHDAIFESYG